MPHGDHQHGAPRVNEPVKIVSVAIGGYGQSLLSALLDRSDVPEHRIVGAVDPEPQRCGRLEELKALDVPIYDTLEEFYEKHEADLALIASPIHMHCPQTCLALAHNTNVMCEKPLAATVREAAVMVRARDHARRFVDIGYQWSHNPAIQSLKRAMGEGVFGAPVRLKCICLWPRTESYYKRNSWAGARRDAGGPLDPRQPRQQRRRPLPAQRVLLPGRAPGLRRHARRGHRRTLPRQRHPELRHRRPARPHGGRRRGALLLHPRGQGPGRPRHATGSSSTRASPTMASAAG